MTMDENAVRGRMSKGESYARDVECEDSRHRMLTEGEQKGRTVIVCECVSVRAVVCVYV